MALETVAIIPARGGSKGIPKKNLLPLAGKPLIAHSILAARAAKRIGRVVLSTDNDEIAAAGRTWGAEVPVLRPAELAEDNTLILPVLQHMIHWLGEHEGYRPDALVLLQPTSPLRRGEDIDGALEVLEAPGTDCVVSVMEVPHQFNPVSVLSIVDGALVPFLPGEGGRVQRRQEKPRVFGRNGPAVYASRVDRLLVPDAHLYNGMCRPYIMEDRYSVDIDSREDLAYAEYLLTAGAKA